MTAAPRSNPFVDGARMSDDEYFALPETKQRCDLIHGVLYVSPAPELPHQHLAGRLYMELAMFARSVGGTALISPLDVHLAPGVTRQPDVCYVSPARAGIMTRPRLEGAPDLVVEVTSPSNRRIDSGPKLALYAEHGVAEIWLVDPDKRTVTVHSAEGRRVVRSRTVRFGEPIPSDVVEVGDAGLGLPGPPWAG